MLGHVVEGCKFEPQFQLCLELAKGALYSWYQDYFDNGHSCRSHFYQDRNLRRMPVCCSMEAVIQYLPFLSAMTMVIPPLISDMVQTYINLSLVAISSHQTNTSLTTTSRIRHQQVSNNFECPLLILKHK